VSDFLRYNAGGNTVLNGGVTGKVKFALSTRKVGTEGAGEHTHAGALGRAHQVMFDWLGTALGASSASAESHK